MHVYNIFLASTRGLTIFSRDKAILQERVSIRPSARGSVRLSVMFSFLTY